MDSDINILIDEARNSLGDFCINECNSYCCRKGHLILTEEELNLTVKDKDLQKKLTEEGTLTKTTDNKFSLNFSNSYGSCPSLVNDRCIIHKDKGRCSTCHKFPIFLHDENSEKVIHLSKRCPAVKANALYPYVYQFISKGYKVE